MTKYLFFTLLIGLMSNGQPRKLISFTLGVSRPFGVGNNFFSKGYAPTLSYDFSAQVNVTKHFFIGTASKDIRMTLKSPEIIGDFKDVASTCSFVYFGYKHYLKQKEMSLEHYIGSGKQEISNDGGLSRYIIRSENSYVLGTRFDYLLSNTCSLYGGVDYLYSTYSIRLSGPYADFYSKSGLLSAAVGLKFSFITLGKKKAIVSDSKK